MDINELKGNEAFKELGDDTLNAFITMHNNKLTQSLDENKTNVAGEIYKSVAEKTGIEYDINNPASFLDVLGNYSTIEEDRAKLADYEVQIEELKKKGVSDEQILKQLADKDTIINELRGSIETQKTESKSALEQYKAGVAQKEFNNELDLEIAKFNFPESMTDNVKNIVIDGVKRAVSEKYKYEDMETSDGSVMVFRDKEGKIITDPNNLSKPMTLNALIAKEGLADFATEKAETGKVKVSFNQNKSPIFQGVNTREEADAMITEHLEKNGFVKKDKAYFAEKTKIWKENNFSKLK